MSSPTNARRTFDPTWQYGVLQHGRVRVHLACAKTLQALQTRLTEDLTRYNQTHAEHPAHLVWIHAEP